MSPGRKPTGPIELLARASWLEKKLEGLPDNDADRFEDPNGWKEERRAFLNRVEMIRMEIQLAIPSGNFRTEDDAEVLTMMGIRAQSKIGGADMMRRWIAKARSAALDPRRQAA